MALTGRISAQYCRRPTRWESVLKRGDIVVYESTVYPGAIEEECLTRAGEARALRAGVISLSAIRLNGSIQAISNIV